MLSIVRFLLLLFVLMIQCGIDPLSGGTTDTGNIRVSAVMYKSDGTKASNALVRLTPVDYLDTGMHKSVFVKETVTDTAGRFVLDSLAASSYCIEVNDCKSEALLFRVTLDSLTHSESGCILNGTLKPYAKVVGSVGRSANQSPRYCFVYGVQRKVPIDSAGEFRFDDLPEGLYDFVIISEEAHDSLLIVNDVSVVAGAKTAIPFVNWSFSRKLVLNTTPAGADVATMVTGFPLLVRLDSTNFSFATAAPNGADIRFANKNGLHLYHEIERWDAVAMLAEIWVKVDTINGNDSTQYIRMFWGNPDIAETPGNREVFDTSVGFQGVWHLGNITGSTTEDATTNRYDGTVSSVYSIEGVIGSAGEFGELTSFIAMPGTADSKLNFPENGNYTLSAWVHAYDILSERFIVGKGNHQYHIKIKDQQWYFTQYANQPSPAWESTSYSLESMVWQHVTGVRMGSTQYLYVNGVCVDSTIDTITGDTVRLSDYDVEIGRRSDSKRVDSQPFYGKLDEIRISSVARRPEWIKLCYMNQRKDDKLVKMSE